MFIRVAETELERLSSLDDEALRHVIEELRAHRRDGLARAVFPAAVLVQPTEGDMEAALTELLQRASDAGFGWPDVATRPEPAALLRRLRGVFREVLQLREHVQRVQTLARSERDLRLAAEGRAKEAATECELVRRAWVQDKGKTVAPRPLRSEAWRAAEKRIDLAVDACKDPDPADLAIVLREKLRAEGIDDALPPLAVLDDRSSEVKAAEARLAQSTIGFGEARADPADLKILADDLARSEPAQ